MVGSLATLASDVTQNIPQFTIHDFFPSIARAFCRLKPGHRNRLISKLYLSHLDYKKKPNVKHSAQKHGVRQATVHWAIGRADMPLFVVKILWTGALNCSLTQQQERFILGAVENKKGVSMRRLAQYSLSKNPVLYLGQPL